MSLTPEKGTDSDKIRSKNATEPGLCDVGNRTNVTMRCGMTIVHKGPAFARFPGYVYVRGLSTSDGILIGTLETRKGLEGEDHLLGHHSR